MGVRAWGAIVMLGVALAACGNPADDVEKLEDQVDDLTQQALDDAEAAVADAEAQAAEALEGAQAVSSEAQEAFDELLDESLPPAAPKPPEGDSSGDGVATTAAPTPNATAPAAVLDGGFNIAGLPDAIAALQAQFGGEPLELLELGIRINGRIVFQVRDPAIPENVDQYEWNGASLLGPEPVRLVGGGDLAESVYPLTEVVPEAIQGIFDAGQALEIEGAEVVNMTLHIDPFRGLVWSVPVNGTRESRVLFATPAGEVLEVI